MSQKAPELCWCWEGNPHTWLGMAPAGDRRTEATAAWRADRLAYRKQRNPPRLASGSRPGGALEAHRPRGRCSVKRPAEPDGSRTPQGVGIPPP
ncbi:DUF5701 family protein [Streptomyces sp. ISL-24]|uniref:DUF5701 family protein n=1 Tax=unclassified Streptomyces TaxID=2593676 RepID=UPI0035ABA144